MSQDFDYKVEFKNGEIKEYTRKFLDTKEGQITLSKLYDIKDDIKITCNCSEHEPLMHMVRRGKGKSYFFRANSSKDHDPDKCPSGLTDEQYAERVKRRIKSYNYIKDGKIYTFFNNIDYVENPIESTPNSDHKGRKSTVNIYSSMFGMGDNLLSNSWTNFVVSKGYNPKEGNLFYELYTNIEKYTIKGGLNLSEVMFVPRYKKSEDLDITDIVIADYENKMSNLLEKNFLRMYMLMKLGSKDEVEEQLNSQKGASELSIKIIDPYKKGHFTAFCKADKFRRVFNKHNVKNAIYYISAYVVVKDEKIVIDKLATIPILEGRGFFVESSNEIEFANYLIEQEILFQRPAKSAEDSKLDWNGWIPDFLILHPSTRKVCRLAEVFGFKDFWDENTYDKKMEEKISFFTSLQGSEIEEFIYWKANKGWKMPMLQRRTGKFLGVQKEGR